MGSDWSETSTSSTDVTKLFDVALGFGSLFTGERAVIACFMAVPVSGLAASSGA